MDFKQIGVFMFKRYLKLLYPMSITALIIFIQRLPALISNGKSAVFKEIIKFGSSLIFGTLFQGNTDISTSWWMLNFIFLGGLIVSIIAAVCWTLDGKKVFFIPIIAVIILFFTPSIYNLHYTTVFVGCALCLFNHYYKIKIHIFIIPILLLMALICGTYPSGFIPQNSYRFMIIPWVKNKLFVSFYYHCGAALFFILAVLKSEKLQNFFSRKIFIFLSKLSLWIYLLHSLIIKLTEKIVVFTIANYNLSVLVKFIITTPLLLFASYLFSKFVTPAGTLIIEKLITKMNKNIEQD